MSAHDPNLPRTIGEYLTALRHAFAGADPALIQDALSDAENHLRAERAQRPNDSEESVLRSIVESYGLPADVAAAYLDTDRRVQAALAPSRPFVAPSGANPSGSIRRFFAVYGDTRSWTSLMLMLLSLVTGILYFCVVTIGVTLSLGLSILIIGLPFFIGFIGLTRVLALVEGRLIEAMTGERMPRRIRPPTTGGWLARIGVMLKDRRTWSTLVYQFLALPLGILYFSIAISLFALGAGLIAGGAWEFLRVVGVDLATGAPPGGLAWGDGMASLPAYQIFVLAPAAMVAGVVMLTLLMHLARGMGRLQGKLAKAMLVEI